MGLFSRLFGRGKSTSESVSAVSPDEIEKIINAYGTELAKGTAGAGVVSDSKPLPFPKASIKAAIQFALRATLDTQMKEQLKIAYISLADWQDGVGPIPVGINLQNLDLNADPLALAQMLAAPDPKVTGFQKRADIEAQELEQELKQLNLW
jgi:hypothetical protein